MKIAVCIKEVPDTATKIELRGDAKAINEAGIKYVINPYDEFALEEALLIKDKEPQTEVITLTIGPERCGESVRKALAMGADRAIHVKTDALPFGESFVVASIIAKLAAAEKVDALFLGKQAVDDDSYQVGPMVAGLLGWSQAMNVVELAPQATQVTATREVEGGTREIYALNLPCVIGMSKGGHEPRYASLKGIMAAKKKEIKTLELGELSVDVAALRAFELTGLSLPAERQSVKMIAGDPAQQATELVRLLREEAKVI